MVLRKERYFEWLGVAPPLVPCLDLHEMIGKKVRAAAQRTHVRDLYDLYRLAHRRYDRPLVRRIAVKCWETHYALDPAGFLSGLPHARFDWSDLTRLIRPDCIATPAELIRDVQLGYAFLHDLTVEEARLASDPYRRQVDLYHELVATVVSW